MLSVREAIAALLRSATLLTDIEPVPLISARGRVLAVDVEAGIDVPPADNSAMDGYALRRSDWKNAASPLPLSQRITAGSAPVPLQPGTAARIFTGAEVPAGADTVVMQEDCSGSESEVTIGLMPDEGANIRRRGQDISRGQRVLEAGSRLRAQDLGLAASLGVAQVDVRRRLRVAILSTGDELVEPGQAAGPAKIYNSNRYSLQGQLDAWGFEVIDHGVVADDPANVREALTNAAGQGDVIITTGGVSVGEEDHVRNVVRELGRIDLWRIAIRPGKPFAFGRVRGTPLIGLPGNPVSVFVTLLIIARPFLFACQGAADVELRPFTAVAGFDSESGSREDYLRVRRTGDRLQLFPNQSSGALFSTCWGDGLVRKMAGVAIREGDAVDYLPWALFN